MNCVADLLAILTNIPEDWRQCPCEICSTVRPLVDFKSAAANDKENDDDSRFDNTTTGRSGSDG